MVYVSNGVRAAVENSISAKIHRVVYNPIDLKPIQRGALRKELGLGQDVPIVGTACRIAAVKRPMAFTEVMVQILRKIPSAHAVVIGAGEPALEEEMRKFVTASDVSSRFHFLGARTDAKELIADLDCFVLTSVREGMGRALMEAMSFRVPVAFWKGEGGLMDLAQMNDGERPFAVVEEQGDVQGLVDDIIRILHGGEEVESMRKREIEVCRRHFDLGRIAGQLQGIYEEVVAGE